MLEQAHLVQRVGLLWVVRQHTAVNILGRVLLVILQHAQPQIKRMKQGEFNFGIHPVTPTLFLIDLTMHLSEGALHRIRASRRL